MKKKLTTDPDEELTEKYLHSAFCPTCGRRNKIQHSPEWLLNRYTGIIANILLLLLECRKEHRSASKRELWEWAYKDTPGGPPITAPAVVHSMVGRERPKLRKLGWDIVGPKFTGNGYQLVALEPQKQ